MELKPRFISVLVVLAFLTLIIIIALKQDMNTTIQESTPTTEERGVMAWVTALTNKDYTKCDSMITLSKEKLFSSQVLAQLGDESYYETALDKLVESISAIQVTKVEEHDGIRTYTLAVIYTPYQVIGGLEYDTSTLDSVKESYLNGEITDTEFQSELSKVYYDLFLANCFNSSSLEAQQLDLILSEKEVDGVTCVSGTVGFIDSLLSDSNLSKNISVYEKDVKETVNKIIKAN